MKVEVDSDLSKELKVKKMSPTTFIFVMAVMLIIGTGVYVAVDAASPQSIEAAKAEEFRQVSRRFNVNDKGKEIPMKFVSGTEKIKEKLFCASIFIKFPVDLINNTTVVGRIIDLISDEIEDAFDRETNGDKIVTAEFMQPARKAYADIIEVVYVVDFINGTSTFTDFVLPIMNQFQFSADHYYKLLNEFRQYGQFLEESYENNENEYEVVTESAEEGDEPEKVKFNPKVSLIEKLRN